MISINTFKNVNKYRLIRVHILNRYRITFLFGLHFSFIGKARRKRLMKKVEDSWKDLPQEEKDRFINTIKEAYPEQQN